MVFSAAFFFQDVDVPSQRNPQAVALADGITGQTPVLSQNFAIFVYEIAGHQFNAALL